MPSSITTSVPVGPIQEFCIQNLYADWNNPEIATCANSSRGTVESDFEIICCDGQIIDTTYDIWALSSEGTRENSQRRPDLADLVCCRVRGPQMGGIGPIIQGDGLTCTTGTPTPLASLAATNADNAQIYPVTYTSASGVPPNVGDFLWTQTPQCLWADTVHGVSLSQVTVPAARVQTLSVGWPDSDDPLITPLLSETTSGRAFTTPTASFLGASTTPSSGSSAAQPTSTPSGATAKTAKTLNLALALGLILSISLGDW